MSLFKIIKKWYTPVLASLALILSLFLHYDSQQKRIPTFVADQIDERKILLANNSENLALFRILTLDGEEIHSDVSALRAYFWNQGNMPIKREDVLTPIKISFVDTSISILDFQITKITREVVNLTATIDSIAIKNVELDFTILEKGDGATFDIIYTGSPQDDITISGIIIGGEFTYRQEFNPILQIIICTLIVLLGLFVGFAIMAPPISYPADEDGVVRIKGFYAAITVGKFLVPFITSLLIAISFYLNGIQGFIPDGLK